MAVDGNEDMSEDGVLEQEDFTMYIPGTPVAQSS